MIERSLRDRRTVAEIIEVDGTRAGFMWATFVSAPDTHSTYMELREISLRPEWQRHGLGGVAATRLEELALERGAEAIRSFSGAENEAGVRFHRSMGYEVIELRYEKRLKPPPDEDV